MKLKTYKAAKQLICIAKNNGKTIADVVTELPNLHPTFVEKIFNFVPKFNLIRHDRR